MTALFYILLFFCIAVILIDSILLLLLVFNFKSNKINIVNYPHVSVLVAARNEEDNIGACLDSLVSLDYPKDKLQILIGNDWSSDKTEMIAKQYEQKHYNVKIYNIEHHVGAARGKANVLAQLASKSEGQYFFITDADVQVPATWIHGMLAEFHDGVGVVTGFTAVSGSDFFARLQHIDWSFAIGFIKVLTDLKIPVTTMGNNMAITRDAYYSTGGYEKIPFSITEDYELFVQVLKNGYKFRQPLNPDISATTRGMAELTQLFQQRKRWMRGAFQLPSPVKILLFFQAIYYICFTVGVVVFFPVFILLGFLKSAIQALFILLVSRKSEKKIGFLLAFLYEPYSFLISISSLIYYIFPNKILWKGRTY